MASDNAQTHKLLRDRKLELFPGLEGLGALRGLLGTVCAQEKDRRVPLDLTLLDMYPVVA